MDDCWGQKFNNTCWNPSKRSELAPKRHNSDENLRYFMSESTCPMKFKNGFYFCKRG